MIVDIKIPEVGESITEGFLVEWKKNDGDLVKVDDELFELETDKITMTVQAEQSGRLNIKVNAESNVEIGQIVGSIDTEVQSGSEKVEPAVTGKSPDDSLPPISTPAGFPQLKEKMSSEDSLKELSPAVRRMVSEFNLDKSEIPGSGKAGRIVKSDVIEHMERKKGSEESATGMETPDLAIDATSQVLSASKEETKKVVDLQADLSNRQIRKPMSRFRQRIAERLLMAQQGAAILTTFNEADMTAVIETRKKYKDLYLEKYGVKLGFMSFFVKSVIEALKKVPAVNAQIDGNDLVYNNYYDIGVAVSTEKGLVVPVVRDADKMTFSEIELKIAELGYKARNKQLSLEELQGGTFTISNGGIFGSMMSTPILNPPQSAILGMHAINKRPVVRGADDHIEVRPMMYLAVSYDHRIIDGAESVTFLKHIVDCIENPERIMLNI